VLKSAESVVFTDFRT